MEVYQAMSAAASPSDLARVLPLLEKLLCQAGLMRATWAEHWQHSWQRATSYCVDWKHALLLTASLQVRTRSLHKPVWKPSGDAVSATLMAAGLRKVGTCHAAGRTVCRST